MRVAFTTFGCKINQYDTDLLRREAEEKGSTVVPFEQEADVYIINTCSVTGKADYQCRQKIRAAARRSSGATVIVTGCYAETRPEEIKSIPGVTAVIGNRDKQAIGALLSGSAERIASADGRPVSVRHRTRAVLKVQDGCDNRCSYCIVPLARGVSRSVPRELVLQSFDAEVQKGVPEIVLSGIHIGTYGLDLSPETSLSSLLVELAACRGPARIRLSSIEPNEVTPEIVSLLGKDLCRHLHIPLQSGDDGILQAMHRRYTAAEYRRLVTSIAQQVPDIALGADVMVGFPGEDDAAFENTCRLVEELPLTHLHVFSFSPRPGTPAASMHRQVPERVKKERNEHLRRMGLGKNHAFRRSLLHRTFEVVPEDGMGSGEACSGLTDNYVRLAFENGNDRNRKGPIKVRINAVNEDGTFGSIACN